MLWTCLRFPQLALDALDAPGDTGVSCRNHAVAVVEGATQRRVVICANAKAQAAGVRAGQALASAQALCPTLHVLARDDAAEHQTLQALAALAWRYSAEVCVQAPDALLLEVGASLKLFGGWPALQRRLRSELAGSGLHFHLAAAPTAAAAHALSIAHPGTALTAMPALQAALAALPVMHSGLEDTTITALHGMGLRRLGELLRLPRAELARRIGPAALAHLDRMRGLAAHLMPRWQPATRFLRRIEFEAAVESTTALAFALQRLVRELSLFLLARDGGVQHFVLEIGHARDARTCIEVGLLTPQRDAASLFELARARLQPLTLPAPAHWLALRAEQLPALVPLHRGLFEAQPQGALDWQALLERLRARLGDAALHGLACLADHRPARAWQGCAVEVATPTRERPPAIASTTRPFWLLRRPLALRHAPLRILAGPERIETGWWDGHDQRRDYYIVELRHGQRAWAFVEAGTQSSWTLHGWFA